VGTNVVFGCVGELLNDIQNFKAEIKQLRKEIGQELAQYERYTLMGGSDAEAVRRSLSDMKLGGVSF
jgi:NTP pyrophosphatase (non-canonical NTP hydrolase)